MLSSLQTEIISHDMPRLGIVMPCYNEEAALPETLRQMSSLLATAIQSGIVAPDSFIACVDDGSKDKTWEVIEKGVIADPLVKGLKLSANVGHQNALLAGLMAFKNEADALISIDADLQDDIQAILLMIEEYKKGKDIVYGVRRKRDKDTFFKRNTALMFYSFMNKLGVRTVYNHADFRLTSKRVLDALEHFPEYNLFLRGLFPLITHNYSVVYYDRLERQAGESKYPLKKMLAFAWDGITSFSVQPLRLVTVLGISVFFFSLLLTVYALVSYFQHRVVVGWVSTVLPMYFLGGIQLFSIGVIGEYIGKIYREVKARPRYIVEKKIGK